MRQYYIEIIVQLFSLSLFQFSKSDGEHNVTRLIIMCMVQFFLLVVVQILDLAWRL